MFVVVSKYDRVNDENHEDGVTSTASKMNKFFLKYNIMAKYYFPRLQQIHKGLFEKYTETYDIIPLHV
jgi:hypothetical protein